MHRTLIGSWITLCIAGGCAAAAQQPAPAPAAPPAASAAAPQQTGAVSSATPSTAPAGAALSADSSLDQILQALNVRGKELKDFSADVSLSHSDVAQGNGDKLTGQMWMQRLPNGNARLRVVFNTRQDNDKPAVNDKREYELDGGWLIDRKYPDRKEVRRQVLQPGQKMDLLKLGEGPFPLPVGQDPAVVKRQFEVKKLPAKPTDPAGTIHVQLIPKDGTRFKDKFAQIDFWVDPASHFPVKIETLDPNETTLTTAELTNIKVNTGLSDQDFSLPPINVKTWNVQIVPFDQ